MKTPVISSVIAVSLALAGNCLALAPIVESFNSTNLDESRWWEYRRNDGRFVQENGKLNFVVATPTQEDFASLELLSSQPGYNEAWEIIVDLSNSAKAVKDAGCGIMLFNVADRRDYLFVDFYGKSGVAAGVFLNGKRVTKGKFSAPNVGISSGSLRIRFDKKKKLMAFHVSLGKPYDWHKIGTFSPDGTDGNVNANWKIGANGRFGVQLMGFGSSNTIDSGEVSHKFFSLLAVP